jgi:peptidoglycan/xylan/chitin deacetylase (PgdA/CDA1 family)
VQVALTIDAEHPDSFNCAPGNAGRLVDLLRSEGVGVTFFIQGRWAMAHPELVKEMAQDGHRLGNHSHFHATLPLLTRAGLREDVYDARRAILSIAGVETRPWFRCPFGGGSRGYRLRWRLRDLGYRHIGWDVEGGDWLPDRSGDELATTIIDRVAERERSGHRASVVLLHTWPDATLAGLPLIIEAGRRQSWEFTSIPSLFGPRAEGHRCATDPPPFPQRVGHRLASLMTRGSPAVKTLPGLPG